MRLIAPKRQPPHTIHTALFVELTDDGQPLLASGLLVLLVESAMRLSS